MIAKVKENPDKFTTPEQFGNALAVVVRDHSKSKYEEGVRKTAAKTEKYIKQHFPQVDFSAAENQEDYISTAAASAQQGKETEESKELTPGQIETLPRVVELRKELETAQQSNIDFEARLKASEHGQELQTIGIDLWRAANPSLSNDPSRRARQVSTMASAIKDIPVKRDEKGKVVLRNGQPIVIDESGAEAVNPADNKSITFLDKLKNLSPVDFADPNKKGKKSDVTDPYKTNGKSIVFDPEDKNWDKENARLMDAGDHQAVQERLDAQENFYKQ
ncbi:MAG: hypothetical protein ACRBFS_19460 [Aureispira sp.]